MIGKDSLPLQITDAGSQSVNGRNDEHYCMVLLINMAYISTVA
jgi:hypothetical protein